MEGAQDEDTTVCDRFSQMPTANVYFSIYIETSNMDEREPWFLLSYSACMQLAHVY
jgi:hypothetical protein